MSARANKKLARIVVFASGRGSNFEAICRAAKSGKLAARVVALVSNIEDAAVIGIARKFSIPAVVVPHKGTASREAHEGAILSALNPYPFDWIVLAGYMRLFSPSFIERFNDAGHGVSRVVNVHPSLLPSFSGVDGYAQAYRHGVKVTGATVHFVSAGLDDGPIIAQKPLEIADNDTLESVSARGLKLEHLLYVSTLNRLFTKRWSLRTDADRARVVFETARGGCNGK